VRCDRLFLYDSRLPFGSSLSCKIFQTISDAVVRAFRRRGFKALSYIDDFIVISDSYSECVVALDCLISLVQNFGLEINWQKVAYPSQVMTFLGVTIDCVNRTLALPKDKLCALKSLLVKWSFKKKATKRDLQSIIGKLSWAARVVRGGRTFIRSMINLLPLVKEPTHYIRLSAMARSDLSWWLVAMDRFHGDTPFTVDKPLPNYEFATDACLSGGAAHFGRDWMYVSWSEDIPSVASSSINVLELC
jgi:hypothetical protein